MSFAPLALFAYNRPMHIRRTVESLLANETAAAADLYIFSDGPKSPAQEPAVAEVRRYAGSVTGFRSVNVVERSGNLGLANSIIDGTTRLTKEFGRVIVLEDDLVVSPQFLEYMNRALERYQIDDSAMQVSGYMFPIDVVTETDAFFMPFTTSWGWATWERAWRHFDPEMTRFDALVRDRNLRDRFNLDGAYDYFDMLERQRRGSIDSWAIRWYLSVFNRGGLTLYPARTLVRNIGFDGSGTHCVVSDVEQAPMQPDFRVARLPARVQLHPDWKKVLAAMPTRRRRAGDLVRNVVAKALRMIRSWNLN
ncbi:MAG TPA: glycosyltransferase [Burkholderiales bacterium]|jgi:GT2 family glycosyltransferase|nr:glycosyltransferase [Burkholderiales bacterium]